MESQYLRQLKHDLRNPVNHILGYSDLLAEETQDLDDEGASSLRALHECGEELLREIEQASSLAEDDPERAIEHLRCALRPAVCRVLELSSPAAMPIVSGQDMVANIHQAAANLMDFVESGALPLPSPTLPTATAQHEG
jgi:signal transduction histidine kinase